jgi:hypothetical protein
MKLPSISEENYIVILFYRTYKISFKSADIFGGKMPANNRIKLTKQSIRIKNNTNLMD